MTDRLQKSPGMYPDVRVNTHFIRDILVKLVIHKIEDLNKRYQWQKFSPYISIYLIKICDLADVDMSTEWLMHIPKELFLQL